MADHGLSAFLVSSLVNVRYLSGFTGTSGLMVITGDEACFLTDFRYVTQAAAQVKSARVMEYKEPEPAVHELLKSHGAGNAGFESLHVTYARAEEMREKFTGVELVPVKDAVETVRQVKDEPEIEAIKWLLDIQAETFNDALRLIRPGAVERDVAVELEYLLRKRGADGPAFDFIVASGVRSAMPHGVASDKVIGKNEMVTLDWGAKGRGYHSDNTRTVITGPVDPELEKIYSIVLEANIAGIEAVRPGVSMKQVDEAARKIVNATGYGDAFGHGTGHGVGLDIHEKPTVSWRGDAVAEPGMVFTVEPGIYLPGKGGVRIEDMVLVTQTGCETLSAAIPKGLIAV